MTATGNAKLAAAVFLLLSLALTGCSAGLPVRESGTFPNLTQTLGVKRSTAEKSLGEAELLDDIEPKSGAVSRFRYFSLWDLQGPRGIPATVGLGLDDRNRVSTVDFIIEARDDAELGYGYQQRDFPGNLLGVVGVEEFEVADYEQGYRQEMNAYLAVWKGRGSGASSSLTWQVTCTLRGANLEQQDITLEIVRVGDTADSSPADEDASSESKPTERESDEPVEQEAPSVDESVEGAEMGDVPTAADLGGTSHKGDSLWFVVAAAERSEGDAWWRISDALPLFGDTQMYFIVEQSSHIEGFEPGLWVVIEAYQDKAHAESGRDWALRAFEDAYIKQGTVNCEDPIPVVEDLVEGY